MDYDLANYFFEEASKAFAFLVDEYSFAAPQIESNENIDFTIVTFLGKHLAIECILDQREDDIDCKVARVINGKKTSHYSVDENRVRVREGLYSLLRRQGVRDRLFRRVQGLELRERIKVTLSDFAEMLRQHGNAILSDSAMALD